MGGYLVLEYEYVIVGGGPTGLQMAFFMQEKKNIKYIVLEREEKVCSFFERYPRHRTLISINKVHTGYDDDEINLRWDWNSLLNPGKDSLLYKKYTKKYFSDAEYLCQYLKDFKEKYKLNVRFKSDVNKISKEGEKFKTTLKDGTEILSKYILIGTGMHKAYIPSIKGIEYAENYETVSINPEDFSNQKVLIIGKGNSAFETANNLVETAAIIQLIIPNSLEMAWRSHFVGHLRAINNDFLDTYQLKSQNAIFDAEIGEIKKLKKGFEVKINYNKADKEVESRYYDRIICCTGFKFDTSIFAEEIKPQLCNRGKFPKQGSDWQSLSTKNMYFIGAVTQYRDYKKYMSGFIHGFRYNVEALFHILMKKNHGQVFNTFKLHYKNSNDITQMILDKLNLTSSLWQQPGFLGYPIEIIKESNTAIFYPYLPVDYIKENLFLSSQNYLIVTLEFGKNKPVDPFNAPRPHRENYDAASESLFLHPVLRYYEGKKLLSEHHLIEDLDAEWKEPEHYNPLRNFISHQILA